LTGLQIDHGEKIKFCGIFRDRFAEKMADLGFLAEVKTVEVRSID